MGLPPLPIDAILPRLVASLASGNAAVLRAPTGAGKTTRVPRALHDAWGGAERLILLLEPRRIAARAAARRMAEELGGRVGDEVGYHVRFDRRAGPRTAILAVTEGVLVRMLQDDPFLEAVGTVIFDEFHERTLDADLALAMVRKLQIEARPDLKMIVMSATLDPAPLARFLGDCTVVESEGRMFDVAHVYLPRRSGEPLERSVDGAVGRALQETDGDVLVFLPGLGEIRRTREALSPRADTVVFELHGDMAPEDQDAVLRPCAGRKVILATNVAETSLTIEGVTAVVDSGQRRLLKYDPATGLDRLELARISQSSARQRSGRAGRTAPGICYRLWSELDHRAMPADDEPEVRRVDVAPAILQLRCWGERDPARFPWFETPPAPALAAADQLLLRLGAVRDGQLTEKGSSMAAFPAHPRIACLLLEGARRGIADTASLAAALLSERDPFRFHERARRPEARAALHHSPSDILDRVHALVEFRERGIVHFESGELHRGAAHAVLAAARQFARIVVEGQEPRDAAGGGVAVTDPDGALLYCLFAAYADRLARRRSAKPGEIERRGVMLGGRGVRIADSSAVATAPLFVCVDLDAGGTESIVRLASAVEPQWIPPDWIQTIESRAFDDTTERVVTTRRRVVEGMTLDEVFVNSDDPGADAGALASAARAHIERAAPKDDGDLAGFLARAACARVWLPDLDLPEVALESVLPDLCAGRNSFAALRKAPWLEVIRSKFSRRQLEAIDRELPVEIAVPSGSRIRIQYDPGKPPVLAVRIQELFGLLATPRIARGTVPLLLHLLAPNYRPQQVTADLQSFWKNTYPQVRKELRARYPRHAWPEDPLTATPQRKPRPRS